MWVRCSPSPVFKRTLYVRLPVRHCRSYSSTTRTDEYGIPLTPSWSVTELLSSYAKPAISSQTLNRLHELAALMPPDENTPEYPRLKEEILELVQLVEAVKLVDTQDVSVSARWDKEDADKRSTEILLSKDIPGGQELLKHAGRTQADFYLVDADKSS